MDYPSTGFTKNMKDVRQGGDNMEIREHGSMDLQSFLRILSEILSDRYKTQITVTAK